MVIMGNAFKEFRGTLSDALECLPKKRGRFPFLRIIIAFFPFWSTL